MPFENRRTRLVLDEETRERLQALSRFVHGAGRARGTGQDPSSFADGETVSALARRLGTNRPKVEWTIDRALRFGVERALDDARRRGRPRQISEEARAWVVSLACQNPKELGHPEELWTTRRLAAQI